MARCYTFLRVSDPVHRHFNFFLRQKRISISDQVAIRNIVGVPETWNNSTKLDAFLSGPNKSGFAGLNSEPA